MVDPLPGAGLPDGLVATGRSPVFERDSLPAALQREHALAENYWAVLRVLAGSVKFEDLVSGEIREILAPGTQVIRPIAPHRLIADGPLRCQIEFFKAAASDPE